MTPPVETAAPVEAAIPPSPSLMPYPSTFSEEEIHDILGAMNSNDNDGDDTGISADSRAKARSERKRSREKQRREDVNKHFGDLSQLLRHIETEDEDGSKWVPATTVGPTNRVDLIARTIIVMERIHKVNMDRKQEIVDLNKQLEDAKKMAEDTAARLKEATMYQQGPQKQVMMMVPMMVNPETMGGAASAPGATAGFMPQQMPFMPQQMMMMPQMPQQQQQMAQAPQPAQANNATPANMQMQMMQQMMQPMMQQQQQMMQPQFNSMMFPQAQAAPVAAAATEQPQQDQQQGQQQQGKQQGSPESGGNLAHCA